MDATSTSEPKGATDTLTSISLYTPLDPENCEIRLLHIVSKAPIITCTLSTYSLRDIPKYCALSYMWGNSIARRDIVVNNRVISVTESLALALEAVHYLWRHMSEGVRCKSDYQLLWADAVSINQDDLEGKNYQIPLMYHIYSRAFMNFAWLGPPDAEILKGFDAVELMASRISQLVPKDRASTSWSRDLDFGTLHTAVSNLMRLQFWRRAWILQELVLSISVVLLCGHKFLLLEDLETFQTWKKNVQQHYLRTRMPRPAHIDQTRWMKLTTPGYDTDPFIGNIMTVKDMISIRQRLSDTTMDRLAKTIGVIRSSRLILHYESFFEASNAKDHVYAFQAILGCNIPIDYSSTKSVVDVYRDMVEFLLSVNIEMPGGFGTLSFLGTAGIGYFKKTLPHLPSWVPNFAGFMGAEKADCTYVRPEQLWHSHRLHFRQSRSAYIRTRTRLYCPSIMLNEVEYVSPRINDKEDYATAGWVRWSLDRVLQLSYERFTFQHKIFGLTECLTTRIKTFTHMPLYGNTDAVLEEDRSLARARLSKRQDGAEEGEDKSIWPYSDDFRRSGLTDMLQVLIKAWFQKHPHHDHSWCAIMLDLFRLPSYAWTGTLDVEGESARDWYNGLAGAFGLCLAETKDGCIGICPPKTQPGDIVAMLQGCPNPIILRKVDRHYVVVGVSYFSVYMKEVKLLNKMLEQGKLREKIVELR